MNLENAKTTLFAKVVFVLILFPFFETTILNYGLKKRGEDIISFEKN